MTPARLRQCLDALGWSARYVASITARDERQVGRWLAGRVAVPWQIEEWLESRVRCAEQAPPPMHKKSSASSADEDAA